MEAGTSRAPATFLLKRSAFTADEVETAEAVASGLGFTVLFAPATRPPSDLTRLLEAADPQTVWSSFDRDLSPSS